jgi:hypothetical protein
MENSDPAPLLRIHPDDNVGVLTCSVRAGRVIRHEDMTTVVGEDLALGHKFALVDIGAGEKVLKYGMPIGSATQSIRQGEHVHLHNLQSDYLPTYTLEGGKAFTG